MSGFVRGFAILAAGSLVGKVVALVREVVFAGAFGTGSIASGFRVAQTASIVPANLVSGDLLSAAFAPNYAREAQLNPSRAKAMLWGYSVWITLVLLFVAGAVYCLRDAMVAIVVPGASPEVSDQAEVLLGLLCWVIPLYGLSAALAYALAAHGNYVPTSTRQMVQSIGLLLGTVAAVVTGWVPWLAVGLLVAWVLNTGICLLLLIRGGFLGVPTFSDLAQGWRFVVSGARGIAPLFFLPIALQLSIVLERVFASFGDPGLIAAVDYARTVSESVMSVVAVPLGILGLTKLSVLADDEYRHQVGRMSDAVVVLLLPVSALLVAGAGSIVNLLYQRGEFGPQASMLTTSVLTGLASGLMFQVLGYSLSRALTASGRNRCVLFCTLAAIAGQIAVQWVGLNTLGPIAIGLGPSVYGLLLTIGCAASLGLVRRVAAQIGAAAPAILASCYVMVVDMPPLWRVVTVAVVWVINIASVKRLRHPIGDHLKPHAKGLGRRVRRQRAKQ
ncbi:murein biosynthesis integral membrane protein MurJ [Arthrobacter sp. UYCu723]